MPTIFLIIIIEERKKDMPLLYHEAIFETSSRYSTLLHSFVIFPVTETIFGMSGCFPVSQGQEMKDLTASSSRKATRGCQCSFSARVWPKNSHEY
jgi:hypothetical protein